MVCINSLIHWFRLERHLELLFPRLASPTCFAEKFDISWHSEGCFVQFLYVVDEKALIVDAVNVTLDCIRIQWTRNAGIAKELMPGKVYVLLPVDTIRGKVHIIRFDDVVGVLSPSEHCWEELIGLAEAKDCWTSEFFYLNKFHVH